MNIDSQTTMIRGLVGDTIYAYVRVSGVSFPNYEWRLNGVVIGNSSDRIEIPLINDMFGMEITCTIRDGVESISITPIPIEKSVEYDIERLDLYPPNIVDGDNILFVIREKNPFNVDFNTIDDTEEARTGLESKGVKFRDLTKASEDDAVFILNNGVAVDADFDLFIGE